MEVDRHISFRAVLLYYNVNSKTALPCTGSCLRINKKKKLKNTEIVKYLIN